MSGDAENFENDNYEDDDEDNDEPLEYKSAKSKQAVNLRDATKRIRSEENQAKHRKATREDQLVDAAVERGLKSFAERQKFTSQSSQSVSF